MKILETGKMTLAVGIGWAYTQFGRAAPLVIMVVAAIIFDYVTGMLAAAKEGGLDSAKGAKGIYKKVGFLCLLGLGFFLDWAIPTLVERGFQISMPVLPFGLIIAAWVVLNECLSVLENLLRLGIQVPFALQKTLKIARDDLTGEKEESK